MNAAALLSKVEALASTLDHSFLQVGLDSFEQHLTLLASTNDELLCHASASPADAPLHALLEAQRDHLAALRDRAARLSEQVHENAAQNHLGALREALARQMPRPNSPAASKRTAAADAVMASLRA